MLLEILVFTCFAVAVLGMLLVAVGYYFRHAQDLLLYHPDAPAGSTVTCDTPKAWDIKSSEHLEIVTADGVTLTGFYMRSPYYNNSSNNNSNNASDVGGAASSAAVATTPSDNIHPSNNGNVSSNGETDTMNGNLAKRDTHNNINNNGGNNNAKNASAPPILLVYFHGNAGNVGHRLSIAKQFLDDCKHCDVLMVDYRGYGLSDAVRPCEVGLQLDASAVMDFIEQRQQQQQQQQSSSNTSHSPKQKIVVMGVSLGGAVALYLASHRKYRTMLSGLILENTFTGISEMADAMLAPMLAAKYGKDSVCWGPAVSALLRYFVKPLLIQIHWRSIDRVPQVGVPILFLSGLRDELVPPSHMKRLFESAVRAPFKRFVAFETGKHNDLCAKDGFFEQVGKFIDYVSRTQ